MAKILKRMASRKRKSLAEPSFTIHGDRDVMSSRMENYWVYGLNIRRILHPNHFMDELLSIVLDYCGPYVSTNQELFFVMKNMDTFHYYKQSVMDIFSSLHDAQVMAIIRIHDYAFNAGIKPGQEICQGLVLSSEENYATSLFQLTSSELEKMLDRCTTLNPHFFVQTRPLQTHIQF